MPTPDLAALVIELRALMPTTIDNHMGRAIQRLGYTLLDRHDPDLAQRVHDLNDIKPFTASGLMRGDRVHYGAVNEGDALWIRFTGLSEEVAAALCAYHDDAGTTVELDRLPWAVSGVHLDGHPWAGTSNYMALIDRHTQARPPQRLTLAFHTPTTFRSQGVNMPLPLPSLVFGSLLSRWIGFTAHRLRDLPQDQLDAYIAHHLLVSRYEMRSDLVRGKQGGKEIGFIGEVRYEVSKKSDHLKKHDSALAALLRAEHPWFARTMGLLADFAFYSGVGRKTTTGMGMAMEQ